MQNGPAIVSIVMLFKEFQVPFPKGLSNEQSVIACKVLLFVFKHSFKCLINRKSQESEKFLA